MLYVSTYVLCILYMYCWNAITYSCIQWYSIVKKKLYTLYYNEQLSTWFCVLCILINFLNKYIECRDNYYTSMWVNVCQIKKWKINNVKRSCYVFFKFSIFWVVFFFRLFVFITIPIKIVCVADFIIFINLLSLICKRAIFLQSI